MKSYTSKNPAFTLIEIILAIGVLSVTLIGALAFYMPTVAKLQSTQEIHTIKSSLGKIETLIELEPYTLLEQQLKNKITFYFHNQGTTRSIPQLQQLIESHKVYGDILQVQLTHAPGQGKSITHLPIQVAITRFPAQSPFPSKDPSFTYLLIKNR